MDMDMVGLMLMVEGWPDRGHGMAYTPPVGTWLKLGLVVGRSSASAWLAPHQ